MDSPTIYRGTTPSIALNVHGIDFSDQQTWPVVVVTLGYGPRRIDFERTDLDIAKTDTGCTVTLALTQAHTLALGVMRPVLVQLRAKDAYGHAVASPIASADVGDVLKDGEI